LLSYTAIARVNATTGTVTFDPDRDFVRVPGGEKKFGVRYDTVSGKYFLLGNPILPAHAGSSIARDLIRNTAAVFTSTDLRQWKLEKVFLYSPNIDYEGFQYFNFDFDGDDIVVASRTAFDVGGFVLGPLISALFAELLGLRAPFLVLLGLYAVAFAVLGRLDLTTTPGEAGFRLRGAFGEQIVGAIADAPLAVGTLAHLSLTNAPRLLPWQRSSHQTSS
jgi:hypothetical protein